MHGDLSSSPDPLDVVLTRITELVEKILVRLLADLNEASLPRIARALEAILTLFEHAALLRPPAQHSSNDGPHPAYQGS